MKKLSVIIAVLLFLLNLASGMGLYDGFEDGNYVSGPSWNLTGSGGSKFIIQDNISKKGDYALEIKSALGNRKYRKIEVHTPRKIDNEDKFQAWFRTNKPVATKDKFGILGLSDAVNIEIEGEFRRNDNNEKIYTNLKPQKWYLLEIEANTSSRKAYLRVFQKPSTKLGNTVVVPNVDWDNAEGVYIQAKYNEKRSTYWDNVVYGPQQRSKNHYLNQSLSNTAFIGSGNPMLTAIALNQTSFISEEYQEVEDAVNRTGLKPVGVGEISGIESTDEVNQAFNISREKYYVDSREKAVYVAALAAEDNASLTFDKEDAGRDFSHYSVQQLQKKFIEEFKPNHVVIADFNSDKGVLAAYMAVRQGILPVDFDHDYSYPEEVDRDTKASEINKYNGVMKLERKLNRTFRRIGENRHTIFEGKYVSILEGPRKMYRDPVEKGLISDPADGNYYFSDLEYGDLDDDKRLEAGVGRYPDDLETASLLFHRSMEREKGEKVVVAAEYLHSNWPVILATFGGGMWDGKNTGYVLEQQGYNVTRLLEQRSQPVSLMFDLLGVPTNMDRFVHEVESQKKVMAKYIGKTGAKAVKNAAYAIRGLNYAEQVLEIYLEFDWIGWQPLNQKLDFPEGVSKDEFRELVLSFLPDRHKQISATNLEKQLGDADIVYYQGVGNSSSWVMPNNGSNSSGLIKNRYTGRKSFGEEDIPELDKSLVWDNSDNAGSRTGDMRKSFLENGASNFLGFSSVNYESYSSFMGTKFFRYGDTVGDSAVEAVNDLRSSSIVLNPASAYKVGVRDKMERSLSIYGNPETVKDPVSKDGLENSRSCVENTCTLRVDIDPEYRIVDRAGGKQYVFNASSYLLQEFASITPLYKFSRELPEGTEVIEKEVDYSYKEVENVSVTRNLLLGHGQQFHNNSLNYTWFPHEVARVNASGDRLEYVQAGIQYRDSGARILQDASMELEYRPPVALELGKENRMLTANLWSDSHRNVTIAYTKNGNEFTESIELEKGENQFKLGELEPGVHEVEATVFQEEVLAKDSETFQIAEPVRVHLFAPEIHAGSQRKVMAVLENHNNFSIQEEVELELSGKVVTGLLVESSREVTVPGESERRVSWKVVGLEEGNGTVTVRDSSTRIRVEDALSSTGTFSPGKLASKISSPRNRIERKRTSSGTRIEWKSTRGKLEVTRNYSHEVYSLETDSFRVEKVETPEKVVRQLRNSQGTYVEVVENGVSSVKQRTLEDEHVEKRFRQLEQEVEKFSRISGQR